MQTDPIADFATSIRNAKRAGREEVVVPHSKLKEAIARVLQEEGYLDEVSALRDAPAKPRLRIKLRRQEGQYALTDIQRVSRSGRRVYVSAPRAGKKGAKPVMGGLGILVISTSQGVKSDHEARKQKIGGEPLLKAW